MGLFRSWARRNRKAEAAALPDEQIVVSTAPEPTVERELTAEARPNPDQPGWGRIVGQTISKAREDR
jgi:hypothetical protein